MRPALTSQSHEERQPVVDEERNRRLAEAREKQRQAREKMRRERELAKEAE